MAEIPERESLPEAVVAPRKRSRISMVWIVPIFAAVVAIGIAIQRIMSEGPTITIVFKAGGGLEAGKTFIKYKDVDIGQVTAVQLSEDSTKVVVTAKITKSAGGLMVEDARFWVVEPRVTLSGVTGLGTLLSGNYIGLERGKSNKPQRKFVGLEIPPTITDQPGRQYLLNASDLGSLGIGSPIYFHRLQVGQVIGYSLADDGKTIQLKIFVNTPYEKYVTRETRFWNASGVDVSIGAGGVDVRTQSLVTLLAGGLAFDTPAFAAKNEAAAPNTLFILYADQTKAMKAPDAVATRYVLYFSESLRGLSVGAPVTWFGMPAGEVTDVGLDFDPKTSRLRGRVEVVSYPERIISRLKAQEVAIGEAIKRNIERRHALVQTLVEQRGLRAQLRSGNLLTGQLFVAMDFFPNAPRVKVDWSRDPTELPVMPSTVTDLEAKVNSIVAKLDKLPLDEISADLRKALVSLDQTIKDAGKVVNNLDADVTPGLKAALEGVRGTLTAADVVIKNTDATLVGRDAPAQQDLREMMQEITRAARSVRVLVDYLERHPESLIRGKTE